MTLSIAGTSSRDSLLSWVRLLGKSNPPLDAGLPVVFLQADPEEHSDIVAVNSKKKQQIDIRSK